MLKIFTVLGILLLIINYSIIKKILISKRFRNVFALNKN